MNELDVSLNIDDTLKNLNELEKKLKTRALRRGVMNIVAPLKQSLKSMAPSDQGDLKKSIGHRSLSRRAKRSIGIDPDSVSIFIGATRKVNTYSQALKARLVEEGVKPSQRSVRRNLKGHVSYKRDGRYTSYSYRHPGQAANPFHQRALQANQGSMQSRFYSGLRAALESK